jgi:hypothetical protein
VTKPACMCGSCKDQRRIKRRERIARAAADPSILDRVGHGTNTAYTYYGCRCEACREGERERQYRYYWTGTTLPGERES